MTESSNSPDRPRTDPDRDRYFRVDHLSSTLRARSVRGGAFTLANQACKFTLTMGSTAVLARLLTPEDFGLIAMVIAIIGFITLFRDMGLSMATVQRGDINHQQVSTLFWINVLIAAGIVLATVGLAPVVAWFYKEPRLVRITIVMATTVFFSGLCVQHQALLRRQMHFGVLAGVEVAGFALAVLSAVVSALAGAGYWALVILYVSRELFTAVGMWLMCRWRPGPPKRRSGVRSMLAFGGHLTGFNIVNYFARNLDKVLIGWKWGAAPLGLYHKAYQILLLPIHQVSSPLLGVAIAALSRLQNQPERFRAYYKRGVMLTVAAGMPVVAFLFVTADKAVLTVLGPQWVEAIAIFRVLGPAAFAGTFAVATGWVYLSLGYAGRQFRWGLLASTLTVLSFVIGLRWGPIGVGAAYSVVSLALIYPGVVYCFRVTHLRVRDLGAALWRPTVSSLGAGAALYALDGMVGFEAQVGVQFLTAFLVYAVFYPLLWVALPGGLRSVKEMANLAGELRRTPRTPAGGLGGGPGEGAGPGLDV